MPDDGRDDDAVLYIFMPQLPGGLDVMIDDRTRSCVIWVREGLTPEEVMARVARGCSEVVRAQLWTRNPTPGTAKAVAHAA